MTGPVDSAPNPSRNRSLAGHLRAGSRRVRGSGHPTGRLVPTRSSPSGSKHRAYPSAPVAGVGFGASGLDQRLSPARSATEARVFEARRHDGQRLNARENLGRTASSGRHSPEGPFLKTLTGGRSLEAHICEKAATPRPASGMPSLRAWPKRACGDSKWRIDGLFSRRSEAASAVSVPGRIPA